MGIYFWDNGTRVDTRKDEAVIYPPDSGVDIKAAEALKSALRAQGYSLTPMQIPQPSSHTLSVRGFKTAADRNRLAELLKEQAERYDVTIRTSGDGLHIEGLESQAQLQSVQRWIEWKGFKHRTGTVFAHEEHSKEPITAMHVRGIDKEDTFLQTVEKDWAKGERKDEFYGQSGIRKQWNKMVKSARSWVGLFFLTGDAQIIFSNILDSRRRGIAFYENENFAEGAGFAIGSSSILVDSMLSEPPGVEGVVNRFKDNFQIGDHYDFEGKSDGFAPEGRSYGRFFEASKGVIKSNSIEILMLADLWSSTGFWRGRYSKVMGTQETNGTRNIVVDEADGTAVQDKRLKWNDAISAVLYPAAASVTAFVPQDGVEKPFVNWPSLGDKISSTPIVGPVLRAGWRFKEAVLDPTILWPVNKVLSWIRKDPFKVGGWIFMAHNINQVLFGLKNIKERHDDIQVMHEQFEGEKKAIADASEDSILPAATADSDVTLGQMTAQERKWLHIIYDFDAGKSNANDVTYRDYIRHYREKLGIPSDFQVMQALIADARVHSPAEGDALRSAVAHFATTLPAEYGDKDVVRALDSLMKIEGFAEAFTHYKRSLATSEVYPSETERYLMVKAMNRLYLDELIQERQTALFKFGGYATFLSGNLMLSHSGEGSYTGVANAMETLVNPLAVAEGVAETLKEKGVAHSSQAIMNAAHYLHQDAAMLPWGFGVEDFAEMIAAKVEGRTSAVETQLWAAGGWQPEAGNILSMDTGQDDAVARVSAQASDVPLHIMPKEVSQIQQTGVAENSEAQRAMPFSYPMAS